MTSNVGMTLLVALYFGMTAFTLAAFHARSHSSAAAVASIHWPR
ncbi:MAG TPA: hypothetical protein VG328_14165 [Stellaceae bacterium]|jgi:hypothetical protein|nr:hypothetical protein [Stellaceae bacterium]